MKLTILGCYSATPRTFNNPTAQVLELRNHVFLIDCGEGTQVQLRKYKVKFARIKHVFISHLHGDHFFGLIGLVSTLSMLNREGELHIHGPKGLKEIITLQLKLSNSWTSYGLFFHEIDAQEPTVVFEDTTVKVTTIPLQHRVYCNGYLFEEKEKQRTLNIAAAMEHGVDAAYYNKAKNGHDVPGNGDTLIPNAAITTNPPASQSYAYCSDTQYIPELHQQLQGVQVIYHEATFQEAHKHLCEKTKHSTAMEAAQVAHDSKATHLILGHYSTRYNNQDGFKEEAQRIFKNSHLAQDGRTFVFDPTHKNLPIIKDNIM